MKNERSKHVLEASQDIHIRKGGIMNIGSDVDVSIKSKTLTVAGILNIAKSVSASWFWKPLIVVVLGGAILITIEYLIKK